MYFQNFGEGADTWHPTPLSAGAIGQ
jgi:hypothetical protein